MKGDVDRRVLVEVWMREEGNKEEEGDEGE